MKNLTAFCAVAAMAIFASNASAQCASCAGGSAPAFAQPVASYAAPAQVYSAPVYNAPVMDAYPQATPAYSAPVEYSSAPAVSSGCSSCAGGMSFADSGVVYGSSEGSMMSGEMSPYSTVGLPAGAVVISDVVSGEGADSNTVEGQVVEAPETVTGSPTEAATPPAPQPEGDSVVPPLPTEDEGEASDDDGA